MNQRIHHQKKTFRDEYIGMLKDYKVEYDEKIIFQLIDKKGSPDGAK